MTAEQDQPAAEPDEDEISRRKDTADHDARRLSIVIAAAHRPGRLLAPLVVAILRDAAIAGQLPSLPADYWLLLTGRPLSSPAKLVGDRRACRTSVQAAPRLAERSPGTFSRTNAAGCSSLRKRAT